MMRAEAARDLPVQRCEATGLVEAGPGDRRGDGPCVDVGLMVGVGDVTDQREAAAMPLGGVLVVPLRERPEGLGIVAVGAKARIAESLGDPCRLAGQLAALLVVRVAAGDECLRPRLARRPGDIQRPVDPATDEAGLGGDGPHPGADSV